MRDDSLVSVEIWSRDKRVISAMEISEGRCFASAVTVLLDRFFALEAANRERSAGVEDVGGISNAALEDVGGTSSAALEDVGEIPNEEKGGA